MEETISLLGVGFYIRAEAARLLKVHPARLNRWVHGYTYRIREESRNIKKYQRPIVRVDLPTVDKITALSFVELMELPVVKSFIDRGISLQRVRIAGERAMKLFNTPHPFATFEAISWVGFSLLRTRRSRGKNMSWKHCGVQGLEHSFSREEPKETSTP